MVASADLIAFANQQKGKPYSTAPKAPGSFDCSLLMQYVFSHFGINLPRTSFDQVKQGVPVNRDVGSMRPGDLVFSSWDGTPNSHVGMYIGGGSIINAPRSGVPVGTASLNSTYMQHVTAVRRIPGVDGQTGPTAGEVGQAATGDGENTNAGLVSAIRDAGSSLASMGESLGTVGGLAKQVTKLALPTNITRAVTGVLGLGFVLVGITFLVREVRT